MKIFKLFSYLILLVVLLLALAIGSENGQSVTLNLLAVKLDLSLAMLIYLSFVLGILTSLLIRFFNKITPKNQ